MGNNKSGLSPVIASVLMIMLVLVLAAMIFLWARGFIDEQIEKFGKPIEELCGAVDFRVDRFGDEVEVVNSGNIDIHYLNIKMIKGGNSEISKFNFNIDSGDAVRKGVDLKINGEEPDEIIAYPVLIGNVKGKGSNKVFTCMSDGIVL